MSNKTVSAETFQPRSRSKPYNRTVHEFEVREISKHPIKIKDVLGHIIFLREQATQMKKSQTTKDLINVIIDKITKLSIPHVLSVRRLQGKLKEVYDTYLRYLKNPDRKVEERKQWMEKDFNCVRKNPSEPSPSVNSN